MKPIFTIHAGEFVFGERIEQKHKDLKLWIPSKDTGVDFLVTNKDHKKTTAVQVKMSKDYRPQMAEIAQTNFEKRLRAGGWFRFQHKKLEESRADIWSLILIFHENKSKPVFINANPRRLLEKLMKIHGKKQTYDVYPWVLKIKQEGEGKDKLICLDGRGLLKKDKELLSKGEFNPDRDLQEFYENWDFLDGLKD